MSCRYIVWINEGAGWEPNGDGPMGPKTAERVAREIRADCGVPARWLVEGAAPHPLKKEDPQELAEALQRDSDYRNDSLSDRHYVQEELL